MATPKVTPKGKPKRGQKVRAGERWTEAKYWGHIRNHLRKAFLFYPSRGEAKKRAGERNGRSVQYRCANCDDLFASNQVDVDHIIPAGSLNCYADLPGFVERLMCEPDGLQVLCKPCHRVKTARQRKEAKEAKQDD